MGTEPDHDPDTNAATGAGEGRTPATEPTSRAGVENVASPALRAKVGTDDELLVERSVALAARLLDGAHRHESRSARRQRLRLARLVGDEHSRAFVQTLTDQVPRIHEARRAAERFRDTVTRRGVPAVAGPLDRLALIVGARLAPLLPRPVMALVDRRLRREASGIVLPAEDPALARHLSRRRAAGYGQNVNPLGEAVLGEQEAWSRLNAVLAAIERDDVDYVSVKITSIYSQVDPLAFDHTVMVLAERLRGLYRAAEASSTRTFVNLDMEAYDDLHLTVAAFCQVLDEEEFAAIDTGIVLQAYIPDSGPVLESLGAWACRRHERAGGTIKVRLVKGANLAMEAVEAEIEGWPPAPFATKAEVDAHYKLMLDVALDPAWEGAVRIGVASHNLFDLAWALTLAADRGRSDSVELEMLEGMAPAQADSVRDHAGRLLLYAPVVAHDDFEAAISYLVRRLDENAAPDNFLRHLFDLEVGTPAWDEQRARFERAVAERHGVDQRPRRDQDRSTEQRRFDPEEPFANEPDTDWSIVANRDWVAGHLAKAVAVGSRSIGPLVSGTDIGDGRSQAAPSADPNATAAYRDNRARTGSPSDDRLAESGADQADTGSDQARGRPPITVVEADRSLVDRTVATVAAAADLWASRPEIERRQILLRVATTLAQRRGEAIATMVHEASKTVRQADPEVSEAIDFAAWYARGGMLVEQLGGEGLRFDPYRVTVVASPWNFPFAIPTGGVMAALAAGSGVILKPAPQTPATARLIVDCCIESGVPPDLVAFLPVPENEVGRRLITHPDVDAVILTGAHDTARLFTSWGPQRRIHAETSGKNALVVTATADLDAAIADIVYSAFGHGGQKCSAASLALVESSVYDGPDFRRRLADATRSLTVGAAADPATSVSALIDAPADRLSRALRQLDDGESWLVKPEPLDDEGRLWTPGVRIGVQPGSWFHQTECFGPVLGVMRVADLDEAIALQNAVDYGLTGGIHSLDPAEVERWLDRVEVGNAYVNRGTTGAIVRRQPFGGWKRSSVGPTAKAGGPNYVLTLGRWHSTDDVSIERARVSFSEAWDTEFSREHDPTGLRFESNVLRYRPLPGVILRVTEAVSETDVQVARLAATTCGTLLELSAPGPRPDVGEVIVEDENGLADRLSDRGAAKLRLPGGGSDQLRLAAVGAGVTVDDNPIVDHGRIELLRWVREQSITRTTHRYGTVL